MYTLYVATNTIALAPHIVLEEISQPFGIKKLDFSKQEQRAEEFLTLNANGRVPLLDTPRGIITEATAILTYLGLKTPEANLLPTHPFDMAKAVSFMSFLASTVHVNHAHRLRGNRWSDDDSVIENLKIKVPENMRDGMKIVLSDYFVGPWALGEHYSVCDAYLFVITGWLAADGVDIADFPTLQQHHEAMHKRDAVQRALKYYQ